MSMTTSDYVLCVNRRDEYEIRLDGLLSCLLPPSESH